MQGSYNWKYRRAYTSCVLDVDRAQVRFLHLAPISETGPCSSMVRAVGLNRKEMNNLLMGRL